MAMPQGKGPCSPPPYDALVELASAQAALDMDAWAKKTLRRDFRGRTCPVHQEAIDVLLVRWLQAHPVILVDIEQREMNEMQPDAFLVRIKAEAFAEWKGIRDFFPRRWGKQPDDPTSAERRMRCLRRLERRWGKK